MDEPKLKLECLFGHVALDTKIERVGDKLIGYGRSRRYDDEGKLMEVSPWEPAGATLAFPEPKGIFAWWHRRQNRKELDRLLEMVG